MLKLKTHFLYRHKMQFFKMNIYLYTFTFLTPRHKLELFDKLITPILNYGSKVWGFKQSNAIERVHLQFCKRLVGVKKTTQNDFVCGELGRTNYQTARYLLIIKYWLKILLSDDSEYIKIIYKEMLNDCELGFSCTSSSIIVGFL